MDKKRKQGIVWGIVAGVIIILGIVLLLRDREQKQDGAMSPTIEENVNTQGPVKNVGTPNNVPAPLSYEQARLQYKDKIIQVNDLCQASPSYLTFKNSTNIMIDNRSAVAHTFRLGNSFSVKAYSFAIVPISASSLPSTFLLDCDRSQNIATVTLQK